ncbi:MAG: hypothetical protein HN348_34530 [Proteobacteria bacterium]|nr:hypothetical protein [Pseudomonadota bacterium]
MDEWVRLMPMAVERFDSTREPYDVVLLDPPRRGAPGVLKRAVQTRPATIIYVSCNIAAAARDLREAPGYAISSVRCFDLFPDTHHFETVIVLRRA